MLMVQIASGTDQTSVLRRTFLQCDPGSHRARRIGIQERRIIMTWDYESVRYEGGLKRRGLTYTAYSGLFANDHTLQYPRTLEIAQLLGSLCYPPIVQRVLPENGIERGQGVTYFIDRLGRGDE